MVLLSVAFSTKVYPPTTIQGKSTNTTVNQTAATPTPSAAAAPPTRNPELEFPATNYYELESRVHTDQWTIPFRQDESLAICLRAAIKMLHHDVAYSDEQCISFMERTLPDAFYKVTTQILSNGAVVYCGYRGIPIQFISDLLYKEFFLLQTELEITIWNWLAIS